MGLSLRKNFAWAFVGNAINAFCMWLLLVILAKISTVETVGVFSLAQAICVPISMLLSCKLQIIQVTDAKNDYDFGHYFGLKIIMAILAVIVSWVVGIWFYSAETTAIVAVLSINYAIISIREVFLGLMQKSERMDKVSISNILLGVFSSVFFAVFFIVTKSLIWGIWGLVLSRILTIVIYDMPVSKPLFFSSLEERVGKLFRPSFDKKILHLAWLAIPLGIVAWFTSLLTSVPRILLEKHCGMAEVGYFGAISSLLVIGTMFTAALGQAASPRLAMYFFSDKKAYTRLLGKLLAIGCLIGIIGIVISLLWGKTILTLLFTPEYAEYKNIFVGVMFAGAILVLFSFMNIGLTAMRSFKVQLIIYGLALLVCLAISFIFIPKYGMAAAIWAVILSYLVGFVGCGLVIYMNIKKRGISKYV